MRKTYILYNQKTCTKFGICTHTSSRCISPRGCILTLLQSAISNVRGTRKTNIQCTEDHQKQCPNVQLLFCFSYRLAPCARRHYISTRAPCAGILNPFSSQTHEFSLRIQESIAPIYVIDGTASAWYCTSLNPYNSYKSYTFSMCALPPLAAAAPASAGALTLKDSSRGSTKQNVRRVCA